MQNRASHGLFAWQLGQIISNLNILFGMQWDGTNYHAEVYHNFGFFYPFCNIIGAIQTKTAVRCNRLVVSQIYLHYRAPSFHHLDSIAHNHLTRR